MDPSKILIHVGVNDIDDQYPEDIANNLVSIAKKFQEKFKCKVYLSDITPRNDHFQGHVQAVNQMLAYKTSKSNIQKVSDSNLSPNYLHDDRHLKRNRSTGELISGVELLCSNSYRALIGKAAKPGTLKNPYATLAEVAGLWNLVSHILEGTDIKHIMIGNLIQQHQLHQIYQGNLIIICIHSIMVITKITCIQQQTVGTPYISLAK